MRRVSETLAGRASYLTLWPMTRRERRGLGRCGLWQELLDAPDDTWPDVLWSHRVPREDWTAPATRGGYLTHAPDLEPDARETWFAGYTRAYLERGVQQISTLSPMCCMRPSR